MIKRLTNLPIRQKFAIVILPLILIIIVFDFLQVKHNYLDYFDAKRLNKAITVGIEINHVVHELQKERSISSGFLSNQGASFNEHLDKQRKKTDSTLVQFQDEISKTEFKDLTSLHRKDLDLINSYYDKIGDLRKSIDEHAISSEESIDEYSLINTISLNTVIKLIDETRDKEIAQQVHAIIYFLKAKEDASIERAIGTQAFSHSHLGFDLYNKFTTLVASQKSFMEAYSIIANEDFNQYLQDIVNGKEVDEVVRMREVLFANDTLQEDPAHWYQSSTTRINLLKRAEDYMTDKIQGYSVEVSDQAFTKFYSSLELDLIIGLIAYWLMSGVVSNLLKNVGTLEVFTKNVSAGDLSKKVVIETKDELGRYADTFNKMVLEIRKSHQALRKQRDKAKFLYENIYGVSMVVFENIHQGIFLLDREFKISKLHSKAMVSIFGNNRIAGENFANFMRPLILPRELEALEMFMKHLFNEEMDEDVVNQLNPIDEVKIHTELDGVVSTKYILVDFTRIHRKGKIQRIMVTVSDETQAILLKQHLGEAEKKKQQETERVLSILKIDPSVLRGFLHNSTKLLKSISERYERNEKEKYDELLSFTMDIIHNLKGNAVVIGMDLMSNKFHEIEEAIVKLKSREIRGKDFLAILYEIDEAERMIQEVSEMLNKIVSIYKKLPSEGAGVSNIMVIDALERGAQLIAKEVGKSVQLTFDNEDNVEIPETYIEPYKDVMIQLIRNSIIHGIEESSGRVSAGKLVKGTITISIEKNPENDLIIKYADDGAGLNLNMLKANALEKGLVLEDELEKMNDAQLAELIFIEGFSTSEITGKHSGRGQGMHVVKSIIAENNGTFKVKNEMGKSFGMIIQYPGVMK
ncbi:MAG: hypothetical protein GY816_11080 [Cytophagales bacterium]|nr:hypothetical protein [Cytophagales bacterium]